MELERCDATLGARVTGVRLAALDAAAWREIEAAFAEHALLIFPGQALEPEEQVAFGRRFGEIEHLFGDRGFVFISNQRPDGSLLEDDNLAMQIMRGNEGWHTDSSYMPCSAKASVFAARVVPGAGGETEWADMRAAYQALDAGMRERIATLSAFHSIRYSQARIGHTMAAGAPAGYGADVAEPPLRPLVKVHPVTGVRGGVGAPARRAARLRVSPAARGAPPLAAGRRRGLGQPLPPPPRASLRPRRAARDGARARGRRPRDRGSPGQLGRSARGNRGTAPISRGYRRSRSSRRAPPAPDREARRRGPGRSARAGHRERSPDTGTREGS
jgi:alpha-ketoglutarate-dependent taurine dioxygenase